MSKKTPERVQIASSDGCSHWGCRRVFPGMFSIDDTVSATSEHSVKIEYIGSLKAWVLQYSTGPPRNQ